jgi:hypothetical protein
MARTRTLCLLGVLVGLALSGCGPGRATLTFLQKLVSPDQDEVYALFRDYTGPSDPAWFVFVFPKGTKPEGMTIPSCCEDIPLWRNRCVLWNWSEDGSDMEGAHIELLNGRFLLMVRGGLYYGLYDTATHKTLLNDPSPWHTWFRVTGQTGNEWAGRPNSEERAACHAWVKENMHARIVELMSAEPAAAEPGTR